MLLAVIMGNVEDMLNVLCSNGFAPLRQAYLNAWLHTGQQVCVIKAFLLSLCNKDRICLAALWACASGPC